MKGSNVNDIKKTSAYNIGYLHALDAVMEANWTMDYSDLVRAIYKLREDQWRLLDGLGCEFEKKVWHNPNE